MYERVCLLLTTAALDRPRRVIRLTDEENMLSFWPLYFQIWSFKIAANTRCMKGKELGSNAVKRFDDGGTPVNKRSSSTFSRMFPSAPQFQSLVVCWTMTIRCFAVSNRKCGTMLYDLPDSPIVGEEAKNYLSLCERLTFVRKRFSSPSILITFARHNSMISTIRANGSASFFT